MWAFPLIAPGGQTLRLPVTRDNSIVLYPGEYHINAGAKSRIRIKGNQHLVALAFDTKPLKGRIVASATLVCFRADKRIAGVTISTIAADWDEHKSNALTSGLRKQDGWGYAAARFPALSGGNSFTLVCQARSVIRDGAYHWQVSPDLVHACALGLAHGLCIQEWEVDYSRNPTIFSREARGREPYLLVTLAGSKAPAPLPPENLAVAGLDAPENLRLVLRSPARGFAYTVKVNGRLLPLWNIPFVVPGAMQVIPLRDVGLRPGKSLRVSVSTLNRLGRRSRSATVSARTRKPARITYPQIRNPGTEDARLPFAVIPLTDKYDSKGRAVGELPAGHMRCNQLCVEDRILLKAARGEVVGFQVLLKGKGKVRVECKIPGMRVELMRALYVKTGDGRRIPDPLVPFDELLLSPAEAVPVIVDVYVPFKERRARVRGIFRVSDGRRAKIMLQVRPFALPRKAGFSCEMNGYGMPDRLSEFYALQQIAYDHRLHVNLLHYSHSTAAPGSRKCTLDMRMDMFGGDGRRMNEKRYNDIRPGARKAFWDDFIAAFGPLLSGRFFRRGHRGAIPVPGFYLTFHESWPLHVRAFFDGNPDAYKAFAKKPVYAKTFVSILKDFIRVARREKWEHAGLQLYLNNKGRLQDQRRNPWILDEPTSYWDFRALAFYADLVRRARGRDCPLNLDFRIDISRPQFDRGELRGRANLWVVNMSAFRAYPRLIHDRHLLTGERIWVYGTSNAVNQSNRTIMAWVMDALRGGATGVVPWQTINKNGSALKQADQLGLFIFDRAAAQPGRPIPIRHSLRLKAFRRAEQDAEYLELLRQKHSLSLSALRDFIDHYLDLAGKVTKRYAGDAGTASYEKLSPRAFYSLREAAAREIAP